MKSKFNHLHQTMVLFDALCREEQWEQKLREARERLEFNKVLYASPGGVKVEFSEQLNYVDEEGMFKGIHFTGENRAVLPEKMFYQTLFFLAGVTDKTVQDCCNHALKKIYRKIDSYGRE